ncbi:MAG: hypothetical protein Q4D94_14655 [Bacillota bacterium]|nr:hypothetical protein [Bacillota bacterium]
MNDALNILTYPDASAEWLHCIVEHRRKHTFSEIVDEMKQYDIIAGTTVGSAMVEWFILSLCV